MPDRKEAGHIGNCSDFALSNKLRGVDVKAGFCDYDRQAELKDDYVLALEETRLPSPSDIAIEHELMAKVESTVKTLPPICQAIYEVLTEVGNLHIILATHC